MDHSIGGKDLLDLYPVHHDAPMWDNASDDDIYTQFNGQYLHSRPRGWMEMRLIVRTKGVDLSKVIPIEQLREQFDHARTVGYTQMEGNNLRGMTALEADGTERPLFTEEYIRFRRQMRLPEYDIRVTEDGGYDIRFPGPSDEVPHWEMPSLTMVGGLYYYNLLKKANLPRFERDLILGHYMRRSWDRIQTLLEEPGATVADFGTRRRNNPTFQWWWNYMLRKKLGAQYRGTSNMLLSMEMSSGNPIGTNGHIDTMFEVAMARILSGGDPEAMRQASVDFMRRWMEMYPRAMWILLPDTYTSAAFYRDGGREMAEKCAGFRPDSMPPIEAIDQFIAWVTAFGIDPMTKVAIPSDGNDAADIVRIYRARNTAIGRISSAIGTYGTNGIDGLPESILRLVPGFHPISMVNKLWRVGLLDDPQSRVSAVKLSDNLSKATGEPDEIAFYKEAFQVGEIARHDVFV